MFGGKSIPKKLFGAPFFLTRDLVRPHISRYRQARSGHLLVVEVNSWVGLFAHLELFLEISVHCERHNLTPCFRSTSRQYVDPARGPDWFAYFFTNPQLLAADQRRIDDGQVPICRIEGIRHLGLPEDYDKWLTWRNSSQLVRKYIGVRPEIRERVEGFFDMHLANKHVLGVHYRGTDKSAEAPRLPYAQMAEAIDQYFHRNGDFDSIFVSSDEQAFVDYITDRYRNTLLVVSHEDQERSRAGIAVHRSRFGDRFRKAEEAVLNCLLLSRCHALLKTASFLSGWSKLFNPELPVTMVNRPYDGQLWFPDREIAVAGDLSWNATSTVS